MKSISKLLCWRKILPVVLLFSAALRTSATPTFWTGPVMTFSHAAFSDPVTSADRLTTNHVGADAVHNVWLTRATTQPLYNVAAESGWNLSLSPTNTMWVLASGQLTNAASLTYGTFGVVVGRPTHSPGLSVNKTFFVHILSDDIYLSLKLTQWGNNDGGSFTYDRSTPAAVVGAPVVTITNPVNGTLFAPPAGVTVQASASDSGGSITNVQFRVGTSVFANVTAAPFSATTNNLGSGAYTLFAIASDNLGVSATNSVNITVDARPTVTVTNPASNALLLAPANVTLGASATDTDGTVTNVQFRVGANILANVTAAPYAATTNNLAPGTYTLSAIATDNQGLTATNAINVTVDAPPAVTITNPVNNALLAPPANVTVGATATDTDGTVTNVQFMLGTNIFANVATAPFQASTNNLAAGIYTFTAIAADNAGATATNSLSVTVDMPPSVTITNPANNTTLAAPANLTIRATAASSVGAVTNVLFLVGAGPLTNVITAPYSAVTNNLGAGSYTLSAVATDNLGVKNTNSVNLNVVTPLAVTYTNLVVVTRTNFRFGFAANVGLNYVIQRNTNLLSSNWVSLVTNTVASNPVVFIDSSVTNNIPAYYRVGRMPNP
jgi:hypothetical protein